MSTNDADHTLPQWLADEAAHLDSNHAGPGVGLVQLGQAARPAPRWN